MKLAAAIVFFGVLLSSPLTIASDRHLPAQEGFAGTWDNVDPATRVVTKVIVSVEAGRFQIRAWGNCSPTDCDWGTVPLHLIGTSIGDQSFERAMATWDHFSGQITTHLIMHLDGAQLVVEAIAIYGVESSRSNHREVLLLRRSPP